MKTTPTIGLRRIAALGLSLAMVGGVSLVAAAPAQADGETVVYASQIRADESTYAGWHQGYANAGDRATVTSQGLELTGESQIINGLETPLAGTESIASASWTTTAESDPAFFQIPVFFGADKSFATLRPSVPESGWNTASTDEKWESSKAIGTTIAANTPVELADLLAALNDQGSVQVLAFGVLTKAGTTSTVTGVSFNGTNYVFKQDSVVAGTVSITGTQAAGSTLTAVPAGWADDVELSYSWGAVAPGQQNSGDIEGANTSTLVVTTDTANKMIWVQVTGHKDGFADSYSGFSAAAPKLPTAPAPVANSTDLAAFLAANDSTPAAQTSTGLPAGDLNPTKSYTANVSFTAGDAFVDVYLYSSPISVGTFPVVNGVAQVTLSASVLSQLAAGSHTLVVVGQFSGAVSSVAISVSAVLAATGFDAAVPFGAAALLLLLGGALVLVRRRRSLHA